MDTLMHADIFFFVTTIAVVIVGILLVIALIYAISIMSRFKQMMYRADAAAEKMFAVYYFIRKIFKVLT